MNIVIGVIVLWASTLGIVAFDKSMRANKGRSNDESLSFSEEPTWGVIVALCIVLNFATLPYYFFSTRRSVVWGFVGFAAFFVCFALMVMANFTAALLGLR